LSALKPSFLFKLTRLLLTLLRYLRYICSKPVTLAGPGKMDNKQAKTKPEIRMIHIRLPEDVHKKVRVRAAESDITIQDWVLEAIREHLKVSGEPEAKSTDK
jgi:NRPS condensation-like uncharacterized protein